MSRIIALHGFLGEPKDFSAFDLDIDAPKIASWSLSSLNEWACGFNQWLKSPVVLGYSMGGRLALHSLIKNPEIKAAIIIAAHPGLSDADIKSSRLQADKSWAQRFLSEPWSELIAAWNEQAIFNKSKVLIRHEEDFNRSELAGFLDNFSLGRQDDLLLAINQLPLPILWLAPMSEREKIAGLNFKNSRSRLMLIDGGHRFIFDDPKKYSLLIKEFLASVF